MKRSYTLSKSPGFHSLISYALLASLTVQRFWVAVKYLRSLEERFRRRTLAYFEHLTARSQNPGASVLAAESLASAPVQSQFGTRVTALPHRTRLNIRGDYGGPISRENRANCLGE